jgi:hypothetical protein
MGTPELVRGGFLGRCNDRTVIATTRDTRLESQILQSMNVQDWFVRTLSHKGQGMDEPRVDEMLFAVQSFDCVSQQERRAVCIAGICMRLYACEHSSGEVQLRPGSMSSMCASAHRPRADRLSS